MGIALRNAGLGLIVSLASLTAVAGTASAQASPPSPQEPWRLFEMLGAPTWLKFGLEQRTRFELLENDFRTATAGENETAAVLRTLFSAELKYESFVVAAEVEDSRVYADDETPLNTSLVDALELLQAYVGLRQPNALRENDLLAATAGRMTIDLGSRRLVARNEYRNTINNFTGVDLQWTSPGKHFFRTFGVLPVFREPTGANALEDNEIDYDEENHDSTLWAVFYGSPPLYSDTTVAAYVIGYDESDNQETPSSNRRLVTPGFRVLRLPAVGRLDYQLEAMLQVGESRASAVATDTNDLHHSAYSTHASIGYRFDAPWTPRVVARFDVASGDSSPTDNDNNRFDPLFGARRFEFGPTSLYGALSRSNIVSPGLRIEVMPRSNVEGFVAYRPAWLESDTDSWTTANLRDATGNSGTFVGNQIEGPIRWHVFPKNLSLEVGAAYLDKGDFATDAPGANPTSPVYFYTQVTTTI